MYWFQNTPQPWLWLSGKGTRYMLFKVHWFLLQLKSNFMLNNRGLWRTDPVEFSNIHTSMSEKMHFRAENPDGDLFGYSFLQVRSVRNFSHPWSLASQEQWVTLSSFIWSQQIVCDIPRDSSLHWQNLHNLKSTTMFTHLVLRNNHELWEFPRELVPFLWAPMLP